jgi:hypothetical protein
MEISVLLLGQLVTSVCGSMKINFFLDLHLSASCIV